MVRLTKRLIIKISRFVLLVFRKFVCVVFSIFPLSFESMLNIYITFINGLTSVDTLAIVSSSDKRIEYYLFCP